MSNYTEIEFKLEELSVEEIVKRWEEIGFLDGFPEEHKEILAINYENMAKYIIYGDHDDKTDGTFETIIFPIIRKVTSQIPIKFDCRMFSKYIFNAKWENIESYFNSDVQEAIKKNKHENITDLFNIDSSTFIPLSIDLEAEICSVLSEYLIDKLK